MTYDEIKKWLEDNNYQNSGLRTDRNHRIDLYLSDVLYDFAQQQVKNLNIPAVSVSLERAKKYGRHQHYLGTQNKPLVEWKEWEAKD